MERLERSRRAGRMRTEAEQEGDGRVLVQEIGKGRQHRSAAQAREREAEGRNGRLRHADQVVAGIAAEAGFELTKPLPVCGERSKPSAARLRVRGIHVNAPSPQPSQSELCSSRPRKRGEGARCRRCQVGDKSEGREQSRPFLLYRRQHNGIRREEELPMRMTFRCDPALTDDLPRPFPARGALPDWLRAMPAKAHSDIHGRDIRTVKQCPPFIDAMAYGVMIPLPCDVDSRARRVLVGVGYSGARDAGASARAAELSPSRAVSRRAVRPAGAGGDQVQQLLDHRTRGRLVAVCDPSGQP